MEAGRRPPVRAVDGEYLQRRAGGAKTTAASSATTTERWAAERWQAQGSVNRGRTRHLLCGAIIARLVSRGAGKSTAGSGAARPDNPRSRRQTVRGGVGLS